MATERCIHTVIVVRQENRTPCQVRLLSQTSSHHCTLRLRPAQEYTMPLVLVGLLSTKKPQQGLANVFRIIEPW